MLVAKHDIELAHQLAKIIAVPVDAERIRQRDRRPSTARATGPRRRKKRLFALRFVVEIPLKEQQFGLSGHRIGHILRAKIGGNPEIGIHRAFTIGRHEDHRARGRPFAARNRLVHKCGANIRQA